MKRASLNAIAAIVAIASTAAIAPSVRAQATANPGFGSFTPPGVTPGISPVTLPPHPDTPQRMGMVPKFSPEFFLNLQKTTLQSGTVLTGILDTDLSSKKSKPGDVFSIRLEDGFSVNGVEIIPKQSKILGSVTSVVSSHAAKRGANPGTITISLQTLIFPDGRTCAFWGFVEHNPLQDNVTQSGRNSFKNTASGYGRMATYGTLGFFTRKVGYNLQRPNFGKEMELKQGEVLPIKTNRPMDLTKMSAPIQQLAMPPGAVNGMYQSGAMPPGMRAVPPNSVPGLPPYTPVSTNNAPGNVPGLSGNYNVPVMPSASAAVYSASQQPAIPYPSQMEPF